MAAAPSRAVIERKRKALERKHGEPFVVLRASNGEVAILSRAYVDSCYPRRTKDNESTK